MTDPYSPLLLGAILGAGTGAAILLSRLAGYTRIRAHWIPTACRTSMALAGLAMATHAYIGHRPGTSGALTVRDFAAIHPAPLVVVAIAIVIVVLARRL